MQLPGKWCPNFSDPEKSVFSTGLAGTKKDSQQISLVIFHNSKKKMTSLMTICFCISLVSVFVLFFAKVINPIDLILNNL